MYLLPHSTYKTLEEFKMTIESREIEGYVIFRTSVIVGSEFGEVVFDRCCEDEITNLRNTMVFVNFNGHCVEIIEYAGDDHTVYQAYLDSPAFKKAIADSWLDRHEESY